MSEALDETASWLGIGYRTTCKELAAASDQGAAAWDRLVDQVAAGQYGEETDEALSTHQRATGTQIAAGQCATAFLRTAEASYAAQPDAYYDMALGDAAAGVSITTN